MNLHGFAPRKSTTLLKDGFWRWHVSYVTILRHTGFIRSYSYSIDKNQQKRFVAPLNVDFVFAQLAKRVQNKDYGFFVNEFATFSDNCKVSKSHIPIQSKQQFTSIIASVAVNLTEFQLAKTMRNMVKCGYTLLDNTEKSLFDDLKTQFLCKETSLRGICMFFTSLKKFHYSWKDDHDNDEKAILLNLIEKVSCEKMTPRQFAELMTAFVAIGVDWNALSEKCQENLKKKMIGLRNKTDLKSAVYFLLAFSSFDGLNFQQQLSQPEKSTFLKITTESLQVLTSESSVEESGEKVFTCLCICSLFFVICIFRLQP
jgi:hypothetical protein